MKHEIIFLRGTKQQTGTGKKKEQISHLEQWTVGDYLILVTVSTSGSIIACFLMQLISKPYTLFQNEKQ